MSHQLWGKRAASGTTDGANADLVLLVDPGFGVEVTNLSATNSLWFTVSEPGGRCPVPAGGASASVGAVDEWVALAGQTTKVRHQGQFGSVVQLISSASVTYQVGVVGARVDA